MVHGLGGTIHALPQTLATHATPLGSRAETKDVMTVPNSGPSWLVMR